jgi:hypothetical protein
LATGGHKLRQSGSALSLPTPEPLLLIYAWNETGEGGFLTPTPRTAPSPSRRSNGQSLLNIDWLGLRRAQCMEEIVEPVARSGPTKG